MQEEEEEEEERRMNYASLSVETNLQMMNSHRQR
jgi:hypothetical protein